MFFTLHAIIPLAELKVSQKTLKKKYDYNNIFNTYFFKEIMMNLKPLSDRVVVRRVDSESVTKGGIVIPDAATEKADQGTVLAVGPGKRNKDGIIVALDVVVDDRVIFGKFSGQTVKVDGETVIIERQTEQKRHRAMHGLYRSLLANLVKGVTEGYKKELELSK